MSWGAPGARVGIGHATTALTVVFTDIEGSTALAEQLGDQCWVDVLSAHDDAVRAALRAHAGREVKTTGDGFMAVFGRAVDAVRAALLLQRLVAAVRVPGVDGGLRVRVGAHAGTVITRGADVLGRDVHVARRVTSAARGGHVLVSSSVKVLVDGEPGLRAGPPRTLRLAGVSEPQVVFDLAAAADGPADATVHVLAARRRCDGVPAGWL